MKNPSDSEFYYIGLTDEQVALLKDQPAHIREWIYEEAMVRMMQPSYADDPYGEDLQI